MEDVQKTLRAAAKNHYRERYGGRAKPAGRPQKYFDELAGASIMRGRKRYGARVAPKPFCTPGRARGDPAAGKADGRTHDKLVKFGCNFIFRTKR